MNDFEKLGGATKNLVDENISKFAEFFPECVTETTVDGKICRTIDFERLKEILGDNVGDGREAYEFNFVGKKQAHREACAGVWKTLRPCREDSRYFDTTKNLYIEGDNLDALKILRESYRGKVKLIYIDPPYNTGNDFIYRDDFSQTQAEFDAASGNVDSAGNRLVKNSDSNGQFHSDWCAMIYSRLLLAKNFLADDGAIFISIDDNEQANLRKICDEIFGAKNFIAQLIWKSKSGGANDSRYFAVDHEYILVYAKTADKFFLNADTEATTTTSYNRKDESGEYSLERLDKQSIRYSVALDFEIIAPDGKSYFPKHKDPTRPNATWRWSKETVAQRYDELVFENGNVYTKNYKKDGAVPRSLLTEERFGRTRTGKTDFSALFNGEYFSNPKPTKLMKFILQLATDKDSIVMDFFSGSATTAHAVMELNAQDGGNRQFIMIQLPEPTPEKSEARRAGYKTICDIGKERIRRAADKLNNPALDAGFRVFKVDSSNIKPPPENFSQGTLDGFVDNIEPDRDAWDLLFGCLLQCGLSIQLPVTSEQVDGFTVLNYNDGEILACFDKSISFELIKTLATRKPKKIFLRDAAFNRSADKINTTEYLKTFAHGTEVKVI